MPVHDTERILQEHIDAWVRGDADTIADSFAPGGVLVNSFGAVTGRDAIRDFYRTVFTDYFPDEARATVHFGKRIVEGDTAFLEWSGGIATYAADTIVVRDGKKIAHSFAAVLNP